VRLNKFSSPEYLREEAEQLQQKGCLIVRLNKFSSRIVQQVRNEMFSHETLSLVHVRYKN